jgi:hypothetical protein
MDTADLLIIAAEPREFGGVTRFWSEVQPMALPVHWARRARWKGRKIVAIANGAGARRSALAAASVGFRQLVNIGFCGALDPKLRIGDIVVGADGLQPKTNQQYFTGAIASIDHIAQTVEEKLSLRASGAAVVEMELAGLRGLPCFAIKSVSDLAGEGFVNDFNSVLNLDGRVNILKLVGQACVRPFERFPELVRLQKRSRVASNTLGEFLESCEF